MSVAAQENELENPWGDAWRRDLSTGLWTFDTSIAPPRQTLDLWRAFSADDPTPTDVVPLGDRSFVGRLAVVGDPGYSTFELDTPPHILRRGEAEIRQGGEDLVLVVTADSGTIVVEQRDRMLLAHPGQIVVVFMDVPFRLIHRDSHSAFGARVPASDFPPALRDQSPLLLDPRSSLTSAIAASYLRWQPNNTAAFAASRDLIKDQFVALVCHGLGGLRSPWAPPNTLGDAARRLIESELGNPDLSAKLLCSRLGISRTTLFEALAAQGHTLGSLIRERRLAGCLADIRRGGGSETLAAISERWGFRDQSTFNRAFRRRFGQPPSQWRRVAQT